MVSTSVNPNSIGSMGFFLKKIKVYRPNKLKEIYGIFPSKLDEKQCYLKKTLMHHWIIEGLEKEFIISSKNSWDPHPINLTKNSQIGVNYKIIAETDRGPQV